MANEDVRTASPEDHRRLGTEVFARFSRGDVAGVLEAMTDDVTWLIPGTPELTPVAGLYDKARLRRLFDVMYAQLERPLQMRVVGSVAEGDRVAMEVESSGDLRNGRRYRQRYHFLIEFRDGKIAAVREYLDTHHAHDVWLRPQSCD
jgi:ketosteroid isomerase-like protein